MMDIDFLRLIDVIRPPSTSYTHLTPLAFGKYYWRMQVELPPADGGIGPRRTSSR